MILPSRQDDESIRAPTRVGVSLSGVVLSCTRVRGDNCASSPTHPLDWFRLVEPVDLRDDELHIHLHLSELHSR